MSFFVAGIDYSTTCPGITKRQVPHNRTAFHYMTDVKKYQFMYYDPHLPYFVKGHERSEFETKIQKYRDQASWALDIVKNCKLVVIEDYAFAAKGRVFHIGENTGLLKAALQYNEIPYEVVAPTKIKKFAAGKGNAKKEDMWEWFQQWEPSIDLKQILDYQKKGIDSPLGDIVDSYFIARYAETLL